MNVKHLEPSRSDVRGFVHKRVIRGVAGAVTGFVTGGPTGAVAGAARGFIGGGGPSAAVQCPPGFDPTPAGGCAARVARVPGLRGRFQRIIPGGATGFEVPAPPIIAPQIQPPALIAPPVPLIHGSPVPAGAPVGVGQAVVGRFGAGIEPSIRMQDIRECPRGAVLAVDGLCYNRRDLRNSERFWPRGRRPLLTGGEMRAISTAASASRKLQRKQKDLQKLGMLPKPTARRAPSPVIGHKATLTHN